MPKPVVGDNGSGMHVHQSIWKDGKNLFAGDGYAGLSEFALYYIGGIIKHARALNAITNPGTNSYKRLVPGFEAPVKLAYSARNRSASIRIPYVSNPKGRRIEVRFPDPTANPYLLRRDADGRPGRRAEQDPSGRSRSTRTCTICRRKKAKKIPTVCSSLDKALEDLDKDREFLTRGGVFSDDMIDAYIELKMEEVTRFRMTTHPIEFEHVLLRCNTVPRRAGQDRAGRVSPPFLFGGAKLRCIVTSIAEHDFARARVSVVSKCEAL